MGDRGNIAIITNPKLPLTKGGAVWLYTHWSGVAIPEIVQRALAKGKDRWTDPPYLARIIFDVLTEGDDGTTGFGIDTSPGDNEHDYIVVDPFNKQVHRYGWDRATHEPTHKITSDSLADFKLAEFEPQ